MRKAWGYLVKNTDDFQLRQGLTSFVNPYSMYLLRDKADIVRNIDHWHIDGISLLKAINFFGKKNIKRFAFDETSVAPIVFNFAKEKNYKIAIIGTKQDVLPIAIEKIEQKHQIKVDFYRNGYFLNEQDIEDTISEIINSEIKIVVSGMGTPLQEIFLLKLKSREWKGYGYTCGGYLHQTARKVNYFPDIFNRLNIRWVYRIYDEPKLLSRYLFAYPKFFLLFLLFILRKESTN